MPRSGASAPSASRATSRDERGRAGLRPVRADFLDLSAPLPGGDLLELAPPARDGDVPVDRSSSRPRSGSSPGLRSGSSPGSRSGSSPGPGRSVQGRQTVAISGRGSEGYATRNGTRPSRAQRHTQVRRHERAGFRPDRVAMWAVLLGMTLILFAAASSHAAVLAPRSVGSARVHAARVTAAPRRGQHPPAVRR